MLKFLRKYNKWLLAIFCVVLMVAFLIQPVMEIFMPDQTKETRATTFGDEKITLEQLNESVGHLQTIRRLNLDGVFLPNLALVPNTGDEMEDALKWMLIQRAARANGIGASKQAAFNLVASVLDAQNEDELDEKAKKQLGVNATYLIEVGKQYLIAEQYRQLVAGIEFTKPAAGADQIASPGLQRFYAIQALNEMINPIATMYQQQYNASLGEARFAALQQLMFQPTTATQLNDLLARIAGYERVTPEQIRYLLQRQRTEVDLTVVVLDAEDRAAGVSVSEADLRRIFERYADDAPGTGQPYGLGYRVPQRVKLEALRIPIDAVRDAVASEIKDDDVVKYYRDNPGSFIDFNALTADAEPKPMPLTAVLREEIRLLLVQARAREKTLEIAQAARLRLNEDARGLKDDGPFKTLPKDFKPTPLVEVSAQIQKDHGVTPEVILVDDWVSAQTILDSARFTETVYTQLPGSSIQMPNAGFGSSAGVPVPGITLGGRAGLFASGSEEVRSNLAQYVTFAKPFVDRDSQAAKFGLQPKLPGRVLTDLTGSSYVFRITDTDPAHPATDMAPIANKVRADTRRVMAYEALAEEKDQLLDRAVSQSVEILMPNADAKKTLTALTRGSIARPTGDAAIEGIDSTAPIIERAFGLTDKILAAGGLDAADAADRLFVVELPGDYKIAVARIDAIRPLTRTAYEEQADDVNVFVGAANIGVNNPQDRPDPLSLESLKAATNFKWEEGFGEDDLDDGEDGASPESEDDTE